MIEKLLAVVYRFWRWRATPKQRELLPDTFSEYDHYVKKYGTYPGEVAVRDGSTCLVTRVEGPPTMNATVEYVNLDEDVEYVTGLVNWQRTIDRKL